MDKENGAFSFRRSMGGFKKEDVIAYISDENKRFMEEKASLEERIAEAELRLNEAQQKLVDQKLMFDVAINEKNEEIKTANSKIEELNGRLENANAKEAALENENESLRALVKACEEQLGQYSEKIAAIEASAASIAHERQEFENVKAENDYLREKYKALESEFRSLSDRLRVMENSPSTLSSSRETQDDPFQRRGISVNSKEGSRSGYIGQGAGFKGESVVQGDNLPKGNTDFTKECGTAASKDPQEVTDKAISSIMAINQDVKRYMSSCVDEFDLYSRDVSSGLSQLAAEISERCKALDEKIRIHKQNVSRNIDSIYNGYNN